MGPGIGLRPDELRQSNNKSAEDQSKNSFRKLFGPTDRESRRLLLSLTRSSIEAKAGPAVLPSFCCPKAGTFGTLGSQSTYEALSGHKPITVVR
jgi:hypothetical protein